MKDPCADCGTLRDGGEMYYVIPPGELPGGEAFWLCTFCWDRLIGLATMGAIR